MVFDVSDTIMLINKNSLNPAALNTEEIKKTTRKSITQRPIPFQTAA